MNNFRKELLTIPHLKPIYIEVYDLLDDDYKRITDGNWEFYKYSHGYTIDDFFIKYMMSDPRFTIPVEKHKRVKTINELLDE
jgi:hypothetical protein